MKRISFLRLLFLFVALTLLAGCAGSSGSSPNSTTPLSVDNVNMIFVVSPDLAYQTTGDVNPDTANLTNQGLQRSLLLATYLKTQVLGRENVTSAAVWDTEGILKTYNSFNFVVPESRLAATTRSSVSICAGSLSL